MRRKGASAARGSRSAVSRTSRGASRTERLLASAGESAYGAAADAVLQGAKGQGHNDFKIPLARRVLAGVLQEASHA